MSRAVVTLVGLLQEADGLAAEKAAMEAPGISGGDILQLNVGGENFVVTRGTLTQVSAACHQRLSPDDVTASKHTSCHADLLGPYEPIGGPTCLAAFG